MKESHWHGHPELELGSSIDLPWKGVDHDALSLSFHDLVGDGCERLQQECAS